MSCKHIIEKGPKKNSICGKKPRDGGDRCYRHKAKPEKEKVNLADDPVFKDEKVVAKVPKTRSSNWAFTINSNQPFEKMTSDEKRNFKKFIEFIFTRENFVRYLHDQNSPDDSNKNIVEFTCDYEFEAGDVKRMLHAHALIRILHSGFYNLRLNDIRALAFKIFKKNVHIYAPNIRDPTAAWGEYLAKTRNRVEIN